MSSPILIATIQATLLSIVSNILAQSIQVYQQHKPLDLDWEPLLQFALFTIVSTPPNFLWQQQLESWFPSQVPAADPKDGGQEKQLSKRATRVSKKNTVKKFLMDQVLGGPVNTVLFLAAMGYFRGLTGNALTNYIQEEFMALTTAGLKLWPAVSILSFSLIPAEHRVVFSSLAALGWNVYLGLAMS